MTTETDDDRQTDNPHSDITFSCPARTGETETRTVMYRDGDKTLEREEEVEIRCGTELTYEEHYIGMRHAEGYEGKALAFKCPDCGGISHRCPVCTGSGTPGWFRGESTGDMIPCHNCNYKEVARQRQRGGI